jgi:hypothetical protein
VGTGLAERESVCVCECELLACECVGERGGKERRVPLAAWRAARHRGRTSEVPRWWVRP